VGIRRDGVSLLIGRRPLAGRLYTPPEQKKPAKTKGGLHDAATLSWCTATSFRPPGTSVFGATSHLNLVQNSPLSLKGAIADSENFQWDAASSQWFSGCICWNTLETLVFTTDVELTFISNFGKSVMAECSRLDTILADQQKGDFIGSVSYVSCSPTKILLNPCSHELRSPLHGILASTEFLSETTIDSYQRSLTDTIDACGRTLLDTINHVLDFSKINSFERTWKRDKTPKSRLRGSSDNGGVIPGNKIPKGVTPLLNIYAVVDLVAITEEVIEGVFAGQMYGNYSGHDITDVSAGASGRGRDRSLTGDDYVMVDELYSSCKVEAILDVTKDDWIFMTQPGMMRRIVMNIFGNAIKYTEHGMIRVALRSEPLRDTESDAPELGNMVTITISDTGKGISPDFLRSKLYTPFAQENSLIPGTGLGLSIVRGIVTMLGGTISIRSEVGRGTVVTISLPLMRPAHKETPSSTSTSMSVNTSTRDDSIDLLCQEVGGRTIAICPIDIKEGLPVSAASKEAQKCLSQYITGWFNLPVTQWSPSVKADVVLVDETCLLSVLKTENGLRDPGGPPAVLVLCTNAQVARRQAKCEGTDTNRVIEFLAKPCGPYKLAKALRACLGKVDLMRKGELPEPERLSSIDSEITLAPTIDETRNGIDSLDLGGPGVQVNGVAMADENSANARKAFRTPLDLEPGSEFPFPDISSTNPYTRNHPLDSSADDPGQHRRPDTNRADSASADSASTVWKAPLKPLRRIPRILVVDDNKINLRLLETFMKKRKYKLVDSADDGKMAVDAFMSSPGGYDIIFMDISMPIMNGFEATQAIRDLELQRELENEGKPPKPRAMIIALTGLASGRDQSQAFASGFDLYVTKPASFKEVAKLLDNWETHTAD
jgi:signal transduction histidine kinase/CheY-like chemotaxis protein